MTLYLPICRKSKEFKESKEIKPFEWGGGEIRRNPATIVMAKTFCLRYRMFDRVRIDYRDRERGAVDDFLFRFNLVFFFHIVSPQGTDSLLQKSHTAKQTHKQTEKWLDLNTRLVYGCKSHYREK